MVSNALAFMKRRGWEYMRSNGGFWLPWGETQAAVKRGRPVHTLRPRRLSPNHKPDLLFVRPRRPGSAGQGADVIYLEVKATGRKPKDEQLEELKRLRRLGFHAWWIDGVTEAEHAALKELYATHFPQG